MHRKTFPRRSRTEVNARIITLYYGRAGKMAVLEQLLGSILGGSEGERCVVVSNSTKTLDLVGALCHSSGWSTVRIAGDVGAAKRQDIVTAFNRHGVGQVRIFPCMCVCMIQYVFSGHCVRYLAGAARCLLDKALD